MSRTVELRPSRLSVAALALLALGLLVGWKFLPLGGEEEARVVEVDGQLQISPEDPVGYIDIATGDEEVSTFLVEELYWEDGSRHGYGAPPCLDENGFADVHAGMVLVESTSYDTIVWVRCP